MKQSHVNAFVDRQSILRLGLSAALLGVIIGLSTNWTFYYESLANAYLSLALGSAVIVLAILRRSWFDLLCVVTGALVLAVVDYRIVDYKPFFMAAFSFAGLSALAVLGVHTIWAKPADRKLLLYGFVPAVLFVASEWTASYLLDFTESLHPKTFDLFLYSFDSSLRVQISFLIGQFLLKHLWLRTASLAIYIGLPLPLALVYASQLRRHKENALAVMIAFLATGPIGVLCYNLLPACGPGHLFGAAFPWNPPSTGDAMHLNVIPVLMKGARNAIPSLHMTWVLLVWWNSRGLARWVRALALVFVGLTVLATLGTGEHYFIDLVVAFPFSLMVQALSSYSIPTSDADRRAAFVFGAFATLIWLALLSFGVKMFWISPAVPWLMIVATIARSVVLWNRLLRAPCEKENEYVPAKVAVATAGA